MRSRVRIQLAVGAAAVVMLASMAWVGAQQGAGAAIALDRDDIGGVVTSAKGPEAGVWVIAETTELPTKLAKIVVTDDQGRYVVPDLPPATYQLFVRGYGLVDSPRQSAKLGQRLNLRAEVAPDAKAAAQYYPAGWWFGMLQLPQAPENQLKFQRL